MAAPTTTRMTLEEFLAFAKRPENAGRCLELDRGEVIEMPPPGELHGVIATLIAHILWQFAFRRGRGHVCGNDTGLILERNEGTLRGADVIFFDEQRTLDGMERGHIDRLPQLVVEVYSPHDRPGRTDRKISQYLQRGIPLVWLVDPEVESVTVYRPGQEFYVREGEDELTGHDVLPDLRLRVADLFALPGQPGV
jgi:Uma2 family endonuclease